MPGINRLESLEKSTVLSDNKYSEPGMKFFSACKAISPFGQLINYRAKIISVRRSFTLSGKPLKPTPTNRVTAKPTPTKPPLPVENDVCSMSSYDTFFMGPDGKTYALKGTQYWIISSDARAGFESGPHKVTDLWKELPEKINAAYVKSTNRLVFFSGSQ